jgi:hypothetical protein
VNVLVAIVVPVLVIGRSDTGGEEKNNEYGKGGT